MRSKEEIREEAQRLSDEAHAAKHSMDRYAYQYAASRLLWALEETDFHPDDIEEARKGMVHRFHGAPEPTAGWTYPLDKDQERAVSKAEPEIVEGPSLIVIDGAKGVAVPGGC